MPPKASRHPKHPTTEWASNSSQWKHNHLFPCTIYKRTRKEKRFYSQRYITEDSLTQPTLQQPVEQGLQATWCWCARCQRVYLKGTATVRRVRLPSNPRHLTTLLQCPYLDCNGSATRDAWMWTNIRSQHPDYPEQPERYIIYAR